MQIKDRRTLLTIVALVVIGLYLGDKILFEPLVKTWKARQTRIADLRKQVTDGKSLLRREVSLQETWEAMKKRTLTNNPSVAEQHFFSSVDGWARDSRVTISALTPQWKRDGAEYATYACRLDVAGNIGSLSKFLYDIQNDAMALRLDAIEVAAHDKQGQQLTMTLQLSALVLNPLSR